MNLIFLGPPGAGKGTQASLLCGKLGLAHIATGDMFRASIASGSKLGREVREIVESGGLVPDDLAARLIAARLSEPDCAGGALFDGFPRTLAQAEMLEGLLAERGGLEAVIFFEIAQPVLAGRIEGRLSGAAAHEKRSDDRPEALALRLEKYRDMTEPLIGFYREKGLLRKVNGSQPVEAVARAIEALLLRRAAVGQA